MLSGITLNVVIGNVIMLEDIKLKVEMSLWQYAIMLSVFYQPSLYWLS